MVKHILKQFVQRDAHPVIQFVKYGIAGGIATAVDIVIFFILAWKVIPALAADDVLVVLVNKVVSLDVPSVSERWRAWLFVVDKTLAFIVSNFVCYIINFTWVFKPGRHSRRKEISLFYIVSLSSWLIGTAMGWALIQFWGMSTTAAYVVNIAASVMINYVCRKYIVFRG